MDNVKFRRELTDEELVTLIQAETETFCSTVKHGRATRFEIIRYALRLLHNAMPVDDGTSLSAPVASSKTFNPTGL